MKPYILIHCTDTARSQAWYQALGFQPRRQGRHGTWAELEFGGLLLYLHQSAQRRPDGFALARFRGHGTPGKRAATPGAPHPGGSAGDSGRGFWTQRHPHRPGRVRLATERTRPGTVRLSRKERLMDDRLIRAASDRWQHLYHEAEIERLRPVQSRLSFKCMTGLLWLLQRAEQRIEHLLNVRTSRAERHEPGVPW